MSEELKPCPFCGGTNIVLFKIRDGKRVGCADCGAAARQTFHGPNGDTDQRAASRWNTRAPAGGWRPIATAPRDGSDIIGCWKTRFGMAVGECWWFEDDGEWLMPNCDWGGKVNPIYWQPMPEPPKE